MNIGRNWLVWRATVVNMISCKVVVNGPHIRPNHLNFLVGLCANSINIQLQLASQYQKLNHMLLQMEHNRF